MHNIFPENIHIHGHILTNLTEVHYAINLSLKIVTQAANFHV